MQTLADRTNNKRKGGQLMAMNDWLMPVMMVMVGVIVIMMVVKEIQGMSSKKEKYVEIPRNTNERLEKAYKVAVKGKLNNDRMRHTLWTTGDKFIQGYRVGDVVAIQPQNEMYKMHIKTRWWYFWKKANPVYIDPILCSDLNAKDIIIKCRGFEAVTDGLIYPIPVADTENLESIYVGRDNYRLSRVLKQSTDDMNADADILLKMAMRGDLGSAGSEIGMPEMLPEIKEESIRKAQEKQFRRRLSEGDD